MRGVPLGSISTPCVNRQVEMFDYAIRSNPIFIVFFGFENQNDAGLFAGLEGVVQTLADRLGPFAAEVKFNRVGVRQAVGPGAIRQNNLCSAALLGTPLILIPPLRMLSFRKAGHGEGKGYQDDEKKFFHDADIPEKKTQRKKYFLTFMKTFGRLRASIAVGAAPASERPKIWRERGFRFWALARAAWIPRGPGRSLWHVDTARASFYARNRNRLKT